jgi:pimeloyl-ACP methyl ester carboxylesterase
MGFVNARGEQLLLRGAGRRPADPFDPPGRVYRLDVGDLGRRSGRSRPGDRLRPARVHPVGGRGRPLGRRAHAGAAAVLDALDARPAVVAGTSGGATSALDLGARRPDLVRAAVVHEAAWQTLRHPDVSGLGTLAKMQWLAWRGRYPDAAETLLRWVYSYRDGGSAWDAFPEQWRQTARENGRSVVADLKGSMGGYPRAQDLAKITAPVVCTYGSRSRPYMRSITRSLAQAIPTASVREIDGAAHAVRFDAPGNFAKVITETMRSSEVRSGQRSAIGAHRADGSRAVGEAAPGTTVVKAAPRTEDSVRAGGDDDVRDPRADVPPG